MQINMIREGLGIRIHRGANRLTIQLSGGLNSRSAPELELELEPLLIGVQSFVLDLSELEYITSAGLRVLLKAAQTVEEGGTMTVENPNSEVREIFERTGFDTVFTILPESSEPSEDGGNPTC